MSRDDPAVIAAAAYGAKASDYASGYATLEFSRMGRDYWLAVAETIRQSSIRRPAS